MAPPKLPKADLQAVAKMYAEEVAAGRLPIGVLGGHGRTTALSAIIARTGWSRNTAKFRLYAARDAGMLADIVAPPVEAPAVDVSRRKLDEAYARARAAEDRAEAAEKKLAIVSNLKAAKVPAAKWLAAPALKKRGKTVLAPLLFSSDFQVGEVIKAAEIDGLNRYDSEEFAVRYQRLIERTIDCAANHTGAAEFPGIIYCRGGDAISGEIHPDLAETNDLSAVPAMRLCMQQEREGIRRLKEHFGRVQVISVVGNHGRTTIKPRSKRAGDLNFESGLAFWLETAFEADARVTFQTSPSADAAFRVFDWTVLLSHGERMGSKGGQGFIGPAATIVRGHRQLLNNWALTGRPVDVVLTGHMHTSMRTTRGFANGSLAGYSEYARDLRAEPDAARQWLLFFHAQRRVSQAIDLQLSDLPRRTVLDEAA